MSEAKSVFFRCDASWDHGSGHVMRCLSLARSLREAGFVCSFLSAGGSVDIVPAMKEFDIQADTYTPSSADLLVVDHYGLDERYESGARSWAKKIMVIDDLADRPHDCDVLLDQTLGRKETDYKKLVPAHCDLLCGSAYTILRPQFVKNIDRAKARRAHVDRVQHILVSFGSTNPGGIIQKVVSTLAAFNGWPLTIDIVVSSQAQDIDEIKEQAKNLTQDSMHAVELNLDVENMADFMAEADLAFGGGGTMSWERACLGLPTILIEVADNQRFVSANMHDFGAVWKIGDLASVSAADIDNAFEKVRDNRELLGQMSEKAFQVCDGKGIERLCTIVQTTISAKAA